MSQPMKGIAVALVQMLIMGSVAVKLMVDRSRYPKVWVETAPYDPDLPIRGRYVRLAAVVEVRAGSSSDPNIESDGQNPRFFSGRLEVRGDRLVAVPEERGRYNFQDGSCGQFEPSCIVLGRLLAFFIPENIPDPSIRAEGEELWVEVTLPPKGAPRPIRLGVKKDGSKNIEPLDI